MTRKRSSVSEHRRNSTNWKRARTTPGSRVTNWRTFGPPFEVYSDPGKFQDHLDRFNRIDADFQAKTREWEELFEQLSGME